VKTDTHTSGAREERLARNAAYFIQYILFRRCHVNFSYDQYD
jgi:hypothetical protein